MITVKDREVFLLEAKKHLPSSPICVELGVLHGDFSEKIFNILNPANLLMVDPYEVNGKQYKMGLQTAYSTDIDYDNVLKRFESDIISGRVVIERRYSYESVTQWSPYFFDFIYHDASHLYEDLRRDLKEWLPKMMPDGLICGHDYINHDSFGVIQAVDEFIKEHNFEMIILNSNGGDFALKRK